MSISLAFEKILGSSNVDTTDAPAVNINWQQTSQTSKKAMLDKFCTYADSVYFKSGTTYYLVDTVAGNGSTTVYEDFELSNQSGKHSGQIVGRFIVNYVEKQASKAPNGAPQLTDVPKQLTASTGVTGQDKAIDVASQTTTLSTGLVIYNNANLQTVLNRKVTLHNRREISITVNGFDDQQVGQRIEFTSESTSGWFILTRKKFRINDLKTELSGLGEFTI